MKLTRELQWRMAYFMLYWEAVFLRIDAWFAEVQGNNLMAADFDCLVYDCERKMQDLKLFRGM